MGNRFGHAGVQQNSGLDAAAPAVGRQTQTGNPDNSGSVQSLFVLFADIRQFSRLTEQVSLQVLYSFLSDYFQLFAASVEEHGGQVNKFLGDGALALFRSPLAGGKALAPVRAALHLHAQFMRLHTCWLTQGMTQARVQTAPGEPAVQVVQVDLGVGISYGEVFLGPIIAGANGSVDVTVIGQAVNVAQRLATDCNPGGVYCTGAARQLLGSTVQVQSLGCFQPKGMASTQSLFQLLALE